MRENTSLTVTTIVEHFQRLQKATLKKDLGIVDMFDVEGVIECPFARPGLPSKVIGRATIASP